MGGREGGRVRDGKGRERGKKKERYMTFYRLYYKIKVPSQPSTVDSRQSHSKCRP